VIRADRRHQLSIADRAIESRRSSRGKDSSQQIERRSIRVERPRSAPAERELRLQDVPVQLTIPEARPALFYRSPRASDLTRGQRAVSRFGGDDCTIRIDV